MTARESDGKRQSAPLRTAGIALVLLVMVGGVLAHSFWRQDAGEPVEISDFLMDTYVTVQVGSRFREEARQALEEMERLEQIFDRYTPGSDVARVNEAGGAWVEVSPEMIDVLERTREARERGLFQVTVGPLVDAWGFGTDDPAVPDPESLARALDLVGDDRLEVDSQGRRVRLSQPGMSLDMGGLAKGYIVEMAGEYLASRGVPWGLVNAGGDIRAVGFRPDGDPWRVGVRHPRTEGDLVGIAYVGDLAVATSGDYQRFFTQDGQRYHHILNVRTGYPAEEVISVTVVAADVTIADVLSTEVFLLEAQEGLALLESLAGVEGVIVDEDQEVHLTSGLESEGKVPWFEPR